MSYIPKPDASGDTLVLSRNPIRTNFIILQDRFDEDHIDLDGSAGGGKHKQSRYVERTSGNEPTTAANESAIWAVEGPTSTETEVYIRRENTTGAISVPTKDLAIFGVASAGLFDATAVAIGTHNVNMTAVRDSLGVFTCTFTNAMPDANYMVAICAQVTVSGVTDNLICWRINTKAAGSMQIVFTRRSGGSNSLIDPVSWNAIIYGGIQ